MEVEIDHESSVRPLDRNAVKADDIKTGELSATSISTYILDGRCAQTMYKQTKQWRDKT